MHLPPSRATVQTLSALAMSALLAASALKHFRDPSFYRQVVPGYLCREEPKDQAPRAGVDADLVSADPDADTVEPEPAAVVFGMSEAGIPEARPAGTSGGARGNGSAGDPGSPGHADRSGTPTPLAIMTRGEWIAVSGLIEAGAAVGLLVPATRRFTATGVTAMYAAFTAGHIDALRRAYGPRGSAGQRKAHTLRLPFQVPLILWAWSLRKKIAR